MEMTLVIVTLVSLALAMAMGVIAWRLLQEERLRATARVMALEHGLADSLRTNPPEPDPIAAVGARVNGNAGRLRIEPLTNDNTDWLAQFPSSAGPHAAHAADAPLGAHAAAVEVVHERSVDTDVDVDASADTLEPSPEIGTTRAGMFAQSDATEDAGLSRRVIAIAAVAAVVVGAVLAFWTIGRLIDPYVERAASANTAGASAAGAATAGPAALELVSLRHVQQDGNLTITGLVRNPYGGAAQERLTAVVFFFDGQGGFLSSTRAPLDFRTLAPGEESPFQLSAPAPPNVARYRVSFRREEGAIVPHVDRRQQEASRS